MNENKWQRLAKCICDVTLKNTARHEAKNGVYSIEFFDEYGTSSSWLPCNLSKCALSV